MHCPNCGLANPDGAKFCANCGTAFGTGAAAPQQPPVYQQPPYQQASYQAPPSPSTNQLTPRNIALGCLLLLLLFFFMSFFSCMRGCGRHYGRRTRIIRRY